MTVLPADAADLGLTLLSDGGEPEKGRWGWLSIEIEKEKHSIPTEKLHNNSLHNNSLPLSPTPAIPQVLCPSAVHL